MTTGALQQPAELEIHPVDGRLSDCRVTIDRDTITPMRDGTRLRADIWRVDDGLARPTILYRTPYDKTTLNLDTLRPNQCVDAGFHVVVQDTRGRFASEGAWAAMMWDQERVDTYDTVEWIASQPWCDGNVGMVGTSYLGIVQWLGAAERPPHLRAIAPAMTTSGELDVQETGGAFRLDHIVSWLGFMAADWLAKQIASGVAVEPETIRLITEVVMDPTLPMRHLPLREIPHFNVPGFPLDLTKLLSGEIDHAPSYDYGAIDVPSLSVGGWYDVFCRATVEGYRRMREDGGGDDERRAQHQLIMGPWAHAGTLPMYQGELNFGITAAAAAAKISDKHLAFFATHLKNEGPAVAGPAVLYFLCQANQWRGASDWPPPESRPQTWYLHSQGTAATGAGRLDLDAPAGDEPADEFTYDPADPVPTRGGRVLYLGRLVGGPFDQQHIEARLDVLTFTSDPLDNDLDVAGCVTLDLFASSSAPDTDFVAKLCDVHPDGRSVLVCDGSLRARFRDGSGQAPALEPGEATQFSIDLGHTAWRFKPGHKLRVSVTSSNFPHLDRNLNTGNALGVDAEGVVAHQRVLHSEKHPSRLVLPVLASAAGGGK